ncbi:hypothetical protein CO154_01435 [Candidatus Pacearchaeota archaeon CG_4_9_14_3_um_filter_31_7]|nr:MAG: hypothetical protein AUJ10_03160 [Candidatus Pacearchaeota archaeon CG1_02_31_27]PIN92405.1 MAG: hypothetical protein COU55_01210 [Candidatus Pacearchaeota archaeon CG10_big_fil_rev_8_21_14_0_10_31_59]PIZ81239.1 MAG: hypothetical protein COX99_00070 [Candidatus Pacearchaeota archaeon CG_4_10_14_0_2_um_filter_31_10]PJA70718.1 MAG: hypothetical protein CO154_01435 [Candidatus Pacearchaeota archaeon CG_4_9_14_3_um_filter_31_7]
MAEKTHDKEKREFHQITYLMTIIPELVKLKNCNIYLLFEDKFKTWELDPGGSILNFEDDFFDIYPVENLESFMNFIEEKLKENATGAFIAMDKTMLNVMNTVQSRRFLFKPDKSLLGLGVFVKNKNN